MRSGRRVVPKHELLLGSVDGSAGEGLSVGPGGADGVPSVLVVAGADGVVLPAGKLACPSGVGEGAGITVLTAIR
jgi:hypothetical protein